jgi:hypothetical protein
MSEEEVVKRKRGRPKRFDPSEEQYQFFVKNSDPQADQFFRNIASAEETTADTKEKPRVKRVRDIHGKFIFSGGRKRFKTANTTANGESVGEFETNPPKTLLFELSEARQHVFGGIDSVISAASKICNELEKLEEENEALKKRIEELERVEATAEKIREWQKKIMHLSKFMDESMETMNTTP